VATEFAPTVLYVLRNEVPPPIPDVGGGFTDDPNDLGGATVYGISKVIRNRENATPAELGIEDFSNAQLKLVTRVAAECFWKTRYWDRYPYAKLSQRCATKVMDAAVNLNWKKGSRNVTAHAVAQLALVSLCLMQTSDVDGVLGPKTVNAINAAGDHFFLPAMVDALVSHYEAIITANPSQAVWRKIWMIRARKLPG
jgi:lysozyme family protein